MITWEYFEKSALGDFQDRWKGTSPFPVIWSEFSMKPLGFAELEQEWRRAVASAQRARRGIFMAGESYH